MASVAEIQASLNGSQALANQARIIKYFPGSTVLWYVVGNVAVPGQSGWVTSVSAQGTVSQATAILSGLRAL